MNEIIQRVQNGETSITDAAQMRESRYSERKEDVQPKMVKKDNTAESPKQKWQENTNDSHKEQVRWAPYTK